MPNFAVINLLTNSKAPFLEVYRPEAVCPGRELNIIIMENLDAIDIKLLKLLQENSRLTTKELSQEVGLSISPVYERVKRLENEGYIERYVAMLNPEKLNLGLMAFISVKLSKQSNEGADEFINVIRNIAEVTECYSMAGTFDFLLKVYAPDMQYYRTFVLDVLGTIESIGNVMSTFVMSEIKHTTALPLRQLDMKNVD